MARQKDLMPLNDFYMEGTHALNALDAAIRHLKNMGLDYRANALEGERHFMEGDIDRAVKKHRDKLDGKGPKIIDSISLMCTCNSREITANGDIVHASDCAIE